MVPPPGSFRFCTKYIHRLKMNFVNVGRVDGGGLNTGSAPVLASAFSDVFHVFSAKKFPGVIESTGLSKCFATQGKTYFILGGLLCIY